jgi:hypothetical protein
VVGRLAIKKARFGVLEVDELTVRKLRVVEHDGPVVRPEVRRAEVVKPSSPSAATSGPRP